MNQVKETLLQQFEEQIKYARESGDYNEDNIHESMLWFHIYDSQTRALGNLEDIELACVSILEDWGCEYLLDEHGGFWYHAMKFTPVSRTTALINLTAECAISNL